MKNPPLDFKKLDFSRPNIAPWLSLPKDLWSLILKDFIIWRKMRVVCKYFANLITPKFCLRIILNDGHVKNCWKHFERSCPKKVRKMIRLEGYDILKRNFNWVEDNNYYFIRKHEHGRNWFRFTILKTEPKIPQVQKYFEITQPYNKVKVRTKDEYDPSRKSNHKKKKFRKVDRRLNFIEMEIDIS